MLGAIDSSSWTALYVFDVVAILAFGVSYYRKCYRQGYRIDFWYTQLFLVCLCSQHADVAVRSKRTERHRSG